jgi:hypothetical protein
MLTKKVIRFPKAVVNSAAAHKGTNSKVGKAYKKCGEKLCNPEYLVDTVNQCSNCKRIKSC